MANDEGPAPVEAPPPRTPSFDYDAVRKVLETEFRVYEARFEASPAPGQDVAIFFVQVADRARLEEQIGRIAERLRAVDARLVALLRREGGEDVILVARKPPTRRTGKGVALLLYLATLLTTVWSGALAWVSYDNAVGPGIREVITTSLQPRYLGLGFLTFSLPLLLILTVHEAAHWFTARRYAVKASYPYFIPVPPLVFFPNIGTFGAVISMRDPMPNRKALFDIGASGPIAGFLVALLVVVLGLWMTSAVAVPVPEPNEFTVDLVAPDGSQWGASSAQRGVFRDDVNRERDKVVQRVALNESVLVETGGRGAVWTVLLRSSHVNEEASWTLSIRITTGREAWAYVAYEDAGLFAATNRTEAAFVVPANATAVEGTFEYDMGIGNTVQLGEPLLFRALAFALRTPADLIIHPMAFAGWVGLLATSINLLPAGQLDGGHVARAVLGDKMKWASYLSVLLLIALSFRFFGWVYLVLLLLLFVGVAHPPPLDDVTELDRKRRALAVLVLLIMVTSFIPVPIYL